ncbi:MAG: YvcK family protein [Chloroflexi bacterium]|jgi:uncharacterized cofD-like protein|nr:YvcK family protein [Chloroflexota bacterium]
MRPLLRKWPGTRWLHPGLGVKRWVLLLVAGVAALSIGLAYLLVMIYRQQPLPEPLYYITLQFLPRWFRALLFATTGLGCIGAAFYKLNRSLASAATLALPAEARQVNSPPRPHYGTGPHIVVLGGGHGLSTLLRGLKNHTNNLTAIVTVADDGGSSGVLRKEMGLLPPGDLRNCIAALARAEPLMTQLFQYRFGRGTGLDGHAFGNLFIAAMAEITGSFESAISEVSRVLAVQGRILPSSLENVVLCAEVRPRSDPTAAPVMVYGQSQIAKAGGIVERVYLQPSTARGYPEAIRAILSADMIVLGPGSLYTSLLPNLLVSDINNAVRACRGIKVFICNVATQPGETDGYDVGDHVRALCAHLSVGFCDYVLANSNTEFSLPPQSGSTMVQPTCDGADRFRLVLENLVDKELPWRHDPEKLATALMRLYYAHR